MLKALWGNINVKNPCPKEAQSLDERQVNSMKVTNNCKEVSIYHTFNSLINLPFFYLSTYRPTIHVPIYPSTPPSICQSNHSFIHLLTYLVYLSTHPPTHPSVYLYIPLIRLAFVTTTSWIIQIPVSSPHSGWNLELCRH